MFTYLGVKTRLAESLNSVLNVKALVGAFNLEEALVGASLWLWKPIVNWWIVCSTNVDTAQLWTGFWGEGQADGSREREAQYKGELRIYHPDVSFITH